MIRPRRKRARLIILACEFASTAARSERRARWPGHGHPESSWDRHRRARHVRTSEDLGIDICLARIRLG
jgi:hypothetical protein